MMDEMQFAVGQIEQWQRTDYISDAAGDVDLESYTKGTADHRCTRRSAVRAQGLALEDRRLNVCTRIRHSAASGK